MKTKQKKSDLVKLSPVKNHQNPLIIINVHLSKKQSIISNNNRSE